MFSLLLQEPRQPLLLSLSIPTAGKPQLGSPEGCLKTQSMATSCVYQELKQRALLAALSSPEHSRDAVWLVMLVATPNHHVWVQTLPWMWLYLGDSGTDFCNCHGWKTSTENRRAQQCWAGGSSVCRAVGAWAPGGDFNSVLDAVPGAGTCWSFKETISKLFYWQEGDALLSWTGWKRCQVCQLWLSQAIPVEHSSLVAESCQAALAVPQGSRAVISCPKAPLAAPIAASERRMFAV